MTMLLNLADVARSAGLNVVEQTGWKTRGHGQMSTVKVITCHHTAPGIHSTKPRVSLNVVQNGRPGLDGPLAHYYLDRDGTVYVVAAGLCWHAGVSRSDSWTNSHAIGIEAEAAGDGWALDWPAVQMDAYRRLCRALIKAFGLDTSEVMGHKETCSPPGRKSDPSFSMPSFRDSIDALIIQESRPKPPVQNTDGDDMRLAFHGGTQQYFLIGVAGKRKLSKANYDLTKAKGVTDMGDMPATWLAEFPTFDELSSEAGQDTTDETSALVPVNAQLKQLAAQQEAMDAKLDQLLAAPSTP